jgi:voltage-gated potassium channel Kch
MRAIRLRNLWTSEESLSLLALAIVIATFVIGPLTRPSGIGNVALSLAYLGILLAGIATVARNRTEAIAVGAVAVLCALAWVVATIEGGLVTRAGRTTTSAFFCLLLSIVVFQRIFRAGHVTVHRISGAVAAYLLIGLVFAFTYDSIETLAPGSFAFANEGARNLGLNDPMAYFSFVTLTTVGYGDVTPLTPLTQSLTNIEALIGQLFPAILIARLVAIEVSPQPEPKDR